MVEHRKRDQERLDELEALFEVKDGIDRETVRDGVLYYRTRTIRSGEMLEAIAYPIIANRQQRREARGKITGEAQRKVNTRNARRHLIRLAQCNFTAKSVFVTLTYGEAPEDPDRELTKYLARLRTAARKAGEKLKYIAVTEISSRGRVHHHILLEGVDRDTAEHKWRGGFANGRNYQDNPQGFKGIVLYMAKWNSTLEDGEGRRKRTRVSKGLSQPRETESNTRMSRGRMERVATQLEESAMTALEAAYPGYVCREMPEVRRSEWLPGAFMYAVMWRKKSG